MRPRPGHGTGRWPRPVVAALAALGALALAGCGVPIGGAHVLARSALPPALLQRRLPTPTTTSTTTPADYVPASVFWVGPNHATLVQATRAIPGTASPRTILTDLLTDLTRGPVASETTQGDTTALAGVLIGGPTVDQQVVTVDFTSPFGQISGPDQVLAVAQVVYTVVGYEGCGVGVAFEIDGTSAAVPIGNGSQTFGPVYQLDYAAQLPNFVCPSPPPGTTTTTTTRPANG
ncbi:MAG: GerMN domain-containing protein [Acidimicrobiales bacterium]